MKKSFLVLNSIFAIAIVWAFVYFLVFNLANDFGFGMRDIWIMLFPVVLCGLLAIPVNAVSLFIWSRQNIFFKKIFGALGKAALIFLPILDFFYIIFLTLFIFPILFEINNCLFEKDASRSCFLYFHGEQSSVDFFWLPAFLILSVLVARWNIFQIKKDKKFILAVLIVFFGVASIILFSMFYNHSVKSSTNDNQKIDVKEINSAAADINNIDQNDYEVETDLSEEKVVEATSTPLVYPIKAGDWKVSERDWLNNSSLFLGKDYKYPANWFVQDDGAGWGGIIVFSDQKWVENSAMILEQYYWFKNTPIYNECTFVISLKNADPIFGGEGDSYAKTLLTVKKYNSKIDKNEKMICDKILKFMNNEIINRVIYYNH
jgi:hypothetical protein